MESKSLLSSEGTLEDAQQNAQRRARYLLVYLHSPDHYRARKFIADVEGDSELQQLIADRFLPWSTSVDTAEGTEHMTNFGATSFPFIAVGVKRKFLLTLQGAFSLQRMKEELRGAIELGADDMAKEIAFQADREDRERLRREQEESLAAAMRRDKAMLEAKAAEKAARERAEREAAEAARRQQEEEARQAEEARRAQEAAEQRALELEAARALALSAVPPEPADDCPADQVGQVKLVAPDGTAFNRRFHAEATVGGLFAFAASLPTNDGRDFQLVTGFPPKPLDRAALEATPMRDVKGLWPRAVVTVRPVV